MVLFIYGLMASGKSTFCNYLVKKYNYTTLPVRRMFEKKVGNVEDAGKVFLSFLALFNNRTHWLDFISDEIEEVLKNNKNIILEGLFSYEEYLWMLSRFKITEHRLIFIEISDKNIRLNRYCKRENLSPSLCKIKFDDSDTSRIQAGVLESREHADIILDNNENENKYFSRIETFMKNLININNINLV